MKKRDRRSRALSVRDERRGSPRRVHDRVLVDFSVDYSSGDTFLFAYITDISAMGIFIQTRTPLPPGTRLNLRFTPAGQPEINVEGEVVWINPYRPRSTEQGNPGMGIQFVELSRATQERITKLVKTFAYLDDDETTLGHS